MFYEDGMHEKLALVQVAMKNITHRPSNLEGTILIADAGAPFDDVVRYAAQEGLWGIEALAGIPGTVGAAPVQNIGAYGSDVAQTIEAVEVFNVTTRQYESLPGRACQFGYRTSIFNTTQKGRYIILRVRFWLFQKRRRPLPREIADEKQSLTPGRVGEHIRRIRAEKIPDYHTYPNCGSFFKNPIIQEDQFLLLQKQYPHIPHFRDGEGIKIPAGWLIEQAGFKGKSFGHVALSGVHALILTTDGKASSFDVLHAEKFIHKHIEDIFGIALVREPEYVTRMF
jgi:UDP-N-acetylmuramate dehydrogenase